MAAVTVNNQVFGYTGNRRTIAASLNAANTNTWATGLLQIDSVSLTPSASATQPACTVAAGTFPTITFVLAASDTALQALVTGV